MTFQPTARHQAIFSAVTSGKGNLLINAVAGSGKTTTLLHMADKLIQPDDQLLFLAFSKAIADELASRLPQRHTSSGQQSCFAGTINSVGLQVARKQRAGKIFVDADKTKKMVSRMMPDLNRDDAAAVVKLVATAKSMGIIPDSVRESFAANGLPRWTFAEWERMIMRFDLCATLGVSSTTQAADKRRILLLLAKADTVFCRSVEDTAVVDFDDMILLPVLWEMAFPKFSWVFVDEAQDLSQLQRVFVERLLKAGGKKSRAVFVGDRRQAIFAFRGADSASMDSIKAQFSCTEYPLDVCYRCGVAQLKLAATWEPTIKPAPNAAAGSVSVVPEGEHEKLTKAIAAARLDGAMVVSRKTATLLRCAYRLLAERVPMKMKADGLDKKILGDIALVLFGSRKKDPATSTDTVETFRKKLEKWEQDALLIAETDEQKAMIAEKKEVLDAIAEACEERFVSGMCASVVAVFTPQPNPVFMMTIHGSKGLEANNVFWIEPEMCPHPRATTKEAQEQETNLMYVAATRARKNLILAPQPQKKTIGSVAIDNARTLGLVP